MKKLLLLFTVLFFTGNLAYSQIHDDCGSNSIFSQSLLDPPSAYSSDEMGNTQLDNFYGLTDPIYGITFWGIMWDGSTDCYIAGPQDFEITFYENVGSGTVGAVFQTFNVTIIPIETGMTYTNSYTGVTAQILKYEVDFPSTVNLPEGWFSVVKKNPTGNPCLFNLLSTTNGDGHSAYQLPGNPIYNYSQVNRAFCLSKAPSVPVSNWALAIGILLIAGFIVVRYRKQIA